MVHSEERVEVNLPLFLLFNLPLFEVRVVDDRARTCAFSMMVWRLPLMSACHVRICEDLQVQRDIERIRMGQFINEFTA